MVRKETISVIIPFYNAAKTLDRCLQGICGQTYDNLEIILVDDGSSDNSSEIIENWKQNDSRIVVLHQENAGASSARNRGLDYANGEYCGFVDADDYIETEMYERLINAMKKDESDIASVSIRDIHRDGGYKDSINADNAPVITGVEALCNMLTYSGGVRVVVWDKLYRAELIRNIRFEESYVYGEDAWFNFNVLLKCPKYSRISYMGYTYDHRVSQVTGRKYSRDNMSNVYGVTRMRERVRCLSGLVYDKRELNQLRRAVNWFSINMYLNIFRGIILLGDYKVKDRLDYIELKNVVRGVKISDVMMIGNIKLLVQWNMVRYCPSVYKKLKIVMLNNAK